MRVPFYETAQVVLNGSGAGTAKVGPLTAREKWYPENVHVNTTETTVTNEAACDISVGDINTKRFRDSTFSGSSGDSSDHCNADVLSKGMFVWADWTGGDAGVTAVLSVTGTKEV